MTTFTLQDVSAGDRVTLEHDDGSKLVNVPLTGTGDYVNIPGFTFHEPAEKYLECGWRITAVEKPEAKVELPSEPGYYADRRGNVWIVIDGRLKDANGPQFYDSHIDGAVAPFTRLAPVPETAKKVLERITELFRNEDLALDEAWLAVAAEFGASND